MSYCFRLLINQDLGPENILLILTGKMLINPALEGQAVLGMVKNGKRVNFFPGGDLHSRQNGKSLFLPGLDKGGEILSRIVITDSDHVQSNGHSPVHNSLRLHLLAPPRRKAGVGMVGRKKSLLHETTPL